MSLARNPNGVEISAPLRDHLRSIQSLWGQGTLCWRGTRVTRPTVGGWARGGDRVGPRGWGGGSAPFEFESICQVRRMSTELLENEQQ
jgi:hypothetical protein